jgi:hypothetical protein
MKELADLFADEETVLRGYIVVSGVRVMGHKYMGPDRTLSVSYAKNMNVPDDADVLWCYVEKERGKAPLVFPVVDKPDDDNC